MNSFILKGNICYSVSKTELKSLSGYVVCNNGKCAGVFEKIPDEYKDFELRDFKDNLIIPGVVDLHIHAQQYAFRGMGIDYELIIVGVRGNNVEIVVKKSFLFFLYSIKIGV